MEKKIEPGCFRGLAPGEGRLLIMRHGAYKDNLLTEQSIRQAMATGAVLKGVIDNCISSPSPRAIRTMLAVQEGSGKMQYIVTDPRLSDLAYGHADEIPGLKKYMEEMGLEWNEPNVAKVIFYPGSEQFELGTSLADEAVQAFRGAANLDKTTLITTHGVSRIEPGLILLRGEKLHIPKRLIEMGQIVEVILDEDENVIEENWLEPVPLPTA